AALGDIDEHVLEGARSLPGGVLVELVKDDHRQREPLARVFLLLEGLAKERTDDEALGLFVQRLDRDDGDVGGAAVDPSVRVRSDEMPEPSRSRMEPAEERGNGAGHHACRPCSVGLRTVGGLEMDLECAYHGGEVGAYPVGLG